VYNVLVIDTHCHLTHERSGDVSAVVASAKSVGVDTLVTIGVTLEDSRHVVDICARNPSVWGAVGVHPLDVKDEGVPSDDTLLHLAQSKNIVALGETGVDLYHGAPSDLDDQKASFLAHVRVAHALNKVVVVHSRGAFSETEQVLEEASACWPGVRYIIHCFSGDFVTAQRFIERFGCYISFSGIVTFKNAQDIQEAAKRIDVRYLLCETDAPYLAPAPHRGQTNQPSWVTYVYEKIAELRGMPVEQLAQVVGDNARAAFLG